MADEYRIFRHTDVEGNERTLRVRNPKQEELNAADMELSGAFNEALLEGGLPPRQRMLRRLKDKGLWTQEDETKLNTLREKLTRLDREVARDRFDSEEAKQAVLDERAEVFREFSDFNAEVNAMLAHTADAKADDAHRNFLLCCVIEEVEADDQDNVTRTVGRVWPEVENLEKEDDFNLQQRCIYEFMMFNSGLESNWEAEFGDSQDDEQTEQSEEEKAPALTDAEGESGSEEGEGHVQADASEAAEAVEA